MGLAQVRQSKRTQKYLRVKMSPIENAKIKNIDHLGIVAGLIDEIGVVEIINYKLGIDPRQKITAGILVKAILINGLGFVSRPLYLFSQFFDDKAIEILLGEDVERDYINKDNQTVYKISGEIPEKPEEIEMQRKETGKFILATNLVDDEKLTPEEIMTNYKNQQSGERGFRFLKDPLFFADSFFVENPERIETMLFLMSLCLLVYNLGQRELRNSLKRIKVGIKNQLGKLTISPTLRWVFQYFQGIHLLTLNGVNQIINLTSEGNYILNCLPSSCQKYYLLF